MIEKIEVFLKRKNVRIAIAAICVVGIGISVYFSAQKKKQGTTPLTPPSYEKIVPSVEQYKTTDNKNYVIPPTLNLPAMAKTIAIYQGTRQKGDLNKLASEIASYFGLNYENTTSVWVSIDGTQFLYSNQTDYSLLYQVNSTANPNAFTGNNNPTKSAAISTANDFVGQIDDLKNLHIYEPDIKYYASGYEFPMEVAESKAKTISIPFYNSTPDNIPVYIDGETQPVVTITIGQNDKIVKIEIIGKFVNNIEKIADKKTSPPSSIKDALANPETQVISSYSPFPMFDNSLEVDTITITSTAIRYVLNSKTNYILPYYQFIGTSQIDGKDIIFEIITPAVDL